MGWLERDVWEEKRQPKCSKASEVTDVCRSGHRCKFKANFAAESKENIFIRRTRELEEGATSPPRDAKYAIELISIELILSKHL